MENLKRNKIIASVIGLVAFIVLVLVIVGSFGNKEGTNEETKSLSEDSRRKLTQEDGESDQFYDGGGLPVILNFGIGEYDITKHVKKWSFSSPIVSLSEMAEEMGLTVIKQGEEFWLEDGEGNRIVYKVGENNCLLNNEISAQDIHINEIYNDSDLLVSVELLPYMEKHGKITSLSEVGIRYKSDENLITFKELDIQEESEKIEWE